MKASPEAAPQWQSFMMEPILYIEPARFAACFEGAIAPSLCLKLKQSRRLQSRLSAVVRAHYTLAQWIEPDQLSDLDRAIALAPPDGLADIARRAGAIYWSAAIAGTVLAKAVAALQQQLGNDLCGYAISHRDLAGPVQPLEPLTEIGPRVEDDGWRCFAAWCATVPAGVGARVKLKLPQDGIADQPVPPPFMERGPTILRRAAA